MRYIYAIILCLLAVSYFVFNGERDEKKDPLIKTNSYFEGLRIVNKKNGSDSWIIAAKKADFTRDETSARMQAVTINAPNEHMTVNADSGTYNMVSKELFLENNIKIRVKNALISAQSLAWNPSSNTLTSTDKVKMDGKKFVVEGEGLLATRDQKLKLFKNVRATFF